MPIQLNHFQITINDFCVYFIIVVLIAILIRVIVSIARVVEYCYTPTENLTEKMLVFNGLGSGRKFGIVFCGFDRKDPFPDFWYNTLLGVFELGVFPVLMKAEEYTFIGAWIGFKSVAQWNAWNKNRYVFNRFLIIHAILILVSFLGLANFVDACK